METRNEKFRRLAELRMTRVFENMNSVAKLSTSKYEYSEAEVHDIFNQYRKLGDECHEYFAPGPTRYNEMPNAFEFHVKNSTDTPSSFGHDRFRYLAEHRMTKVVQYVRKIASLSVKTNYTYTSEEIDELFEAYFEKGHAVESLFLPLSDEFHFKPKD